MVKLKAET